MTTLRDRCDLYIGRTAAERLNAMDGMNEKHRKEIIDRISQIQATEGITDTLLAGMINCSPATLNQIKAGKYAGNTDKWLHALNGWMASYKDSAKVDEIFVQTSIASNIISVCDMAVFKPCMGVVCTPSGWGKSAALREVARDYKDKACYIQAGEALKNKNMLLAALADRLGVPRSDAYWGIAGKLAKFFGGGNAKPFLIIVDEATTLQPTALNLLRNLHDDPACRAAVVLADTADRLNRFLHGHSSRVIEGGNEQLRSRAKAQYIVEADDKISRQDVSAVAHAMMLSFGCDARLDKAALDYLERLANTPGGLRNVTSRLENVHYIASKKRFDATYSVQQIDYVATLSGDKCQIQHPVAPFLKRAAS